MTTTYTAPAAPARVWISGPITPSLVALVRGLGCLTMTRGEVLAEHFDDAAEGAKAVLDTLSGASALAHDGCPDPVELVVARAHGLKIIDLS